MRLKLGLVVAGILFLLLAGMRPDALPYPRYEARFSDAVTAHWPNALFLRESVQQGEFPLWRETTMAGQPFAANPLNKTAYPFQWLAVIFPPALQLNILIAFHLLFAGVGMWYWARSIGLSQSAALFSTAIYTFAPQMLGRVGVGHVDIVYALAWWPWLMFTIRRSVDDDTHPLRHIVQTSLLSALLFTADSRIGLYALLTGATYELVLLWKAHRLNCAGSRLLVVPLFLILTAAVLIPLRLWQPFTNRAALTPEDAGVFSLEVIQLLGLFMPTYQSTIESLTYVGLGVLVLAVFGLLSRPKQERRLGLVALLLIFFYGMGSNSFLWPLLVRLVPALLWFRVPSRVWLVLTLWLAVWAGFGLDWLLNKLGSKVGVPNIRRDNLLLAVFMLIMVVFGIFAIAVLRLPAAVGLSMLVIGPALGGVLLAGLNGRLSSRTVAIAMTALTLLDLFWTGYQLVGWRGPEFWLDPYRPLAEALIQDRADRIYSPTYSLEQQVAEAYHLHLFGGVDPFQLTGIVDAVSQGSGIPNPHYSITVPPLNGIDDENDLADANRGAILDTRVLAQWQVSHVVSGHPLDNPHLQLLDTINAVYVYRNLDYVPSISPRLIPDWPADWPNLPSIEQVQRFNQITILAAVISGVGWIVALGFFIYLTLKTRR